MLRTFTTAIVTALFSTASLAATLAVGDVAPSFKAVDALSGKTLDSTTLKGKTVVMEWNNPGCPFVNKFYSVGAMQEQQATAVKDGVVWVAVNSSAEGKEGYLATSEEAKKFVTEKKAHPSYYLLDHDGKIGHAFGAKSTPHMFVIDQDGKLAYEGAIDNKATADSADIATATNYVTEALKSLKAGTPIKTASTRSYGCSVKY